MMLIPANTHNISDSLRPAVDNKELIYFYEAEHDFDEREKKSGTLSIRNSDAGLQFLEPATTALKLNILKEADYGLTLKGKGNFSLSIADSNGYNRHVDHLQSEALDYTWSNSSVHLTPGEYELLISSTGGSYLDQVMLHTGNRPIHQLLDSDPPGRVISYDKISPTSYEVKVKSDAPFLLAFAEGYDRFWIAKAKSSENSRQFNSVPLYGLINGFWVDQTGEFSLIIEYEPQDWFNISAVISITSFVCVILYLAHPQLKLRRLFTILRYQQRRSNSLSK
jgi:hypothetical protein